MASSSQCAVEISVSVSLFKFPAESSVLLLPHLGFDFVVFSKYEEMCAPKVEEYSCYITENTYTSWMSLILGQEKSSWSQVVGGRRTNLFGVVMLCCTNSTIVECHSCQLFEKKINKMDIDLNSEPQDGDDVTNKHGQLQKAGCEFETNEQMELYVQGYTTHQHGQGQIQDAGDMELLMPTASDYELQPAGTETGTSIREPTENTARQNEDGGNEDADDANSQPLPPAPGLRFDSFKSAQEHYRAYAQRTEFGIRIDWSRKDDDGEYLKVTLVCTYAGKNYEGKEDTQNPKGAVRTRGLTDMGYIFIISVDSPVFFMGEHSVQEDLAF